jgi:hypothetical protein
MSRALRRRLMILFVVLVSVLVVEFAYRGPGWLGAILVVTLGLVLISALDWLKARRLKAHRLKARGIR